MSIHRSIKISKDPKSGGIDFEFENGHIYQCGVDWFKDSHTAEYYFRHLRDKDWFTDYIENIVMEITGLKPRDQNNPSG